MIQSLFHTINETLRYSSIKLLHDAVKQNSIFKEINLSFCHMTLLCGATNLSECYKLSDVEGTIKWFIEQGDSFNAKNINGDTILHELCSSIPRGYNLKNIIDIFIENGLSLDEPNKKNVTPRQLLAIANRDVFSQFEKESMNYALKEKSDLINKKSLRI